MVSGAWPPARSRSADLGQADPAHRRPAVPVRRDPARAATRATGTTYASTAAAAPFTALAALENRVIADGRAGAAPPVDAATWERAYEPGDQRTARLRAARRRPVWSSAARRPSSSSSPASSVAGVLGLIAVIVTLDRVRPGRPQPDPAAGRAAPGRAGAGRSTGCPRGRHRLRRGEEVDVAAEAPPLPYGDDEIGQVGHAFNEVQRTAVKSAVEEAERAARAQRGLPQHRPPQPDAAAPPAVPAGPDGAARRPTRRSWRTCSGSTTWPPGCAATPRTWSSWPAPRPAGAGATRCRWSTWSAARSSEVEDYARVTSGRCPRSALVGRAVGDVIHLLAELIENATSFSPPHTRVQRRRRSWCQRLRDRDRGPRPGHDRRGARPRPTRRLADPPEFDPANSARLGLFVVARLAARHGIRVQLRASPYGGVTAVVLVPDDLVVVPGERAALPSAREPAALTAGPNDVTAVIPAYRDDQPDPPLATRTASTYEAQQYDGNGTGYRD